MKNLHACLNGVRKHTLLVAVAATVVASLGAAAPALAKSPTGDYAVFSQCPRFTKGVELCLYSLTNNGEVTLNKQNVPITNPITLQGGISGSGSGQVFVGALNGETLSKSPQAVPGGLAGLVECYKLSNFFARVACELAFENGLTGVNAITELAKPASDIGVNTNNLVNGKGVALSLPVKIRLENPFLGSECYIGSASHPITWNLTTGATPEPNSISGKIGEIVLKDEGEFVEITKNSLVDNKYSAPEASGCGGVFSFLIDPIINAKIGLESPVGKNTTILNNRIREATTEGVIESEK